MSEKKTPDEFLISGIKEGLTNAEICRRAGQYPSVLGKRIKRLREELGIESPGGARKAAPGRPFDLRLYDTVSFRDARWMVTSIEAEHFTLKHADDSSEISAEHRRAPLRLRKGEYTKPGSLILKKCLPEVKVYHIPVEASDPKEPAAGEEAPLTKTAAPECFVRRKFLRDIESLLDLGWEEDLLPSVERLASQMLAKGLRGGGKDE